MCEPCTPEALLEAVRGLWLADPGLGPKLLLAKLRAQQPDLGASTREVREALTALKAEIEATEAATAALPAAAPPAAVRCRASRCGRRAFACVAGAEPRLLRLRPAAVRDGRRP